MKKETAHEETKNKTKDVSEGTKQGSRITKAIEFAAKAHAGQLRKGTYLPYIIHPIEVGRILTELNVHEDIIIAGILHDTVEDTPVTFADIEKEFGAEVANLVKFTSEPPQKTHSWKERKEHTFKTLQTAPLNALFIACADKLHNVKSIKTDIEQKGNKVWEKFHGTKADQKWYYEEIAKLFLSRANHSLFNEYKKEVEKVFGSNDS